MNYALFTFLAIGQVSALAPLEGGWLHADRLDPRATGTLWGAAVGFTTANCWLFTSFTVAIPLA
ncbi:TPA: hypothetical protein R4Y95_000678 [Klebsiella variicola subsp. variicola]|uniref:hypothetical protein n=1 Tax=Klebsiella TaxID=570 RepID=UPI0013B42314|nr:hypothetical protein [Klebsiella sp. w6]MBC5380499.1 hypothetical protein [Klebsiella variicola]HBT4773410.1 hypothetical protein [Klebsiella variicola subsp. variicola]MBR7249814.1 hypothetical protein [Klebsiella variicola]MCJ4875666.1 hypothetical protein [Klebsiella variicola]MCJ6065795.1 hypothetical protein [Klebsiella variicola]